MSQNKQNHFNDVNGRGKKENIEAKVLLNLFFNFPFSHLAIRQHIKHRIKFFVDISPPLDVFLLKNLRFFSSQLSS
jgi:hypothetical protein